MGIRISPPPEPYGTDCLSCCLPDGPWETGKVPKKVYAFFNNLEAYPVFDGILPNGKSFILLQHESYPCWWVHDGSIWYVRFIADIPGENASELLLSYKPLNKLAFQGRFDPCPFEYYGFNNLITSPSSFVCCGGGIGVVCWNSIPQDLVQAFGLNPSSDLFLENFSHDDGSRVAKFTDVKDATNIKIKFNL